MENPVAENPGIVDKDVDAPECVERSLGDGIAVPRLDDIESGGDGFAASRLDFGNDLPRRTGIAALPVEARTDVTDDDAGAFPCHEEGDRPANATPSASNDCDFSVDNSAHLLFLVPTVSPLSAV
jgi:hypothetical protein